jgi:hypothetical protein
VLAYEDHGKEPKSILTAALLEGGAACWFIDDDGALYVVRNASDASRWELERERGYHFLAARDPYAPARLFG